VGRGGGRSCGTSDSGGVDGSVRGSVEGTSNISGDHEGGGPREIDGTVSAVHLGVGGEEGTSEESVLCDQFVGPGGEGAEIDVGTPGSSTDVTSGDVVGVGHGSGEGAGVGNEVDHGVADGAGGTEGAGGVDDAEHALLTMLGCTTVEEVGGGIVDDLVEDEALILFTGSKWRVSGLVARQELAGLGHGVVVGTPLEHDGVTNGGVEGEWDVTKDTLGGGNNNSVGNTVGTGLATILSVTGSDGSGGGVHGGGSAVRGQALVHAVVVVISTPVAVSGPVRGGRVGLERGGGRGGSGILGLSVVVVVVVVRRRRLVVVVDGGGSGILGLSVVVVVVVRRRRRLVVVVVRRRRLVVVVVVVVDGGGSGILGLGVVVVVVVRRGLGVVVVVVRGSGSGILGLGVVGVVVVVVPRVIVGSRVTRVTAGTRVPRVVTGTRVPRVVTGTRVSRSRVVTGTRVSRSRVVAGSGVSRATAGTITTGTVLADGNRNGDSCNGGNKGGNTNDGTEEDHDYE